jgi:hypothetical protein
MPTVQLIHSLLFMLVAVMALPVNTCRADETLFPDDPAARGLAIARKSYETDSGFVDFYAELTLIQDDGKGKKSKRHIRLWGLENEKDGDRSMSVFVYPPDVKGMARLSHTHQHRPDDHWVYVPANQRVRRVSPTSQLSYFMGTEFTYEDLRLYRAEGLSKYAFLYLGDDVFGNMPCYKIRRMPVHKKFTNYSSQVLWIDKKEFRILKIDFYDKHEQLVKTLIRSHFKLYEGKFWAMEQMRMINHRTGRETLVLWSNYRFGLGLRESDFTRESLKRIK